MREFIYFIGGFKKGSGEFAQIIINIVNFVLLFFVYFIGIGMTSVIAKLFGKHFIDLNQKKKNSTWIVRHLKKQPIKNYYRQF